MKKILGMGNALVDIMTTLPDDGVLAEFNLPKGSMQLVDSDLCDRINKRIECYNPKISAGGSAANTIKALAHLGEPCGFIGKTSRDKLGTLFRQDLATAGVEPHVLDSQSATGHAIALVSPNAERTFATHLGAAVELSASEIDPKVFAQYDYFYIEGYLVQNHELIESAVKTARSLNMKVAIDLASYNVVAENLDFLRRISKEYVDIIFANEEEAKAFTGKEAEAAAEELAALCDIAVVKVGKRGSIIRQGDKVFRAGIIDANCIDTTGAGDFYAAGFMFGLASGYSLDRCGQLGALLSGKVIESLGAQISPEGWDFVGNEMKKI